MSSSGRNLSFRLRVNPGRTISAKSAAETRLSHHNLLANERVLAIVTQFPKAADKLRVC